MANVEHLEILKKGVPTWNEWRENHPNIRPDLEEAKLRGADLTRANLMGANLFKADLRKANLHQANLYEANLRDANLEEADLNKADLSLADLHRADLRAEFNEANFTSALLEEANLRGAHLFRADLTDAVLRGTDLSGADLNGAVLMGADLSGAILKDLAMGWTVVADIDLSTVKELKTVQHKAPSTIGIDTVYRSQGKIPEVFLRGAGVPEEFITYMRSLVANPIEFYSCFISYSSNDQHFAERLYADLQAKNVRCWFAPEDMKIGDRIRPRIDEAICVHDKLLLVLTGNSMKSPWVEKEVETAFEKERKQGRTVLFPIRLDDAVMDAEEAWATDIRRTRHIGDFQGWMEHDKQGKRSPT
jgi:uncharacterized protein YjbI with pentapeptide repeats